MITLYTIGFTKKSAEHFFELLKKNHVQTLVDVRISNSSQLAGFAKGNDLIYFLKQIGNIGYRHVTDFAPTKELLSDYRAGKVNWAEYERVFADLMTKRRIKVLFSLFRRDTRTMSSPPFSRTSSPARS